MSFPATSFTIGSVPIHPPLVMAPLHDLTDLPFRRMIRRMGGVGLTVSEMISSEALIRRARKAERMMAAEGEHPFAMQLNGCVPEHLAQAARLAQMAGADLLDLNMGCPAGTVTRGGSGSALLRNLPLAEACLTAMIKAVDLPVTVKMRAGWDQTQKDRGDYLDFLRMFEAVGVQGLTLHPRTRAQQYEGHADWSIIARAVEARPSFPIIGNGDVHTAADALRMVAETGCQGVMIGRAALTNPWIFRQIMEPGLEVGAGQRVDLCLDFFTSLLELLEPREALNRIKKLGSWFTKGIPDGVLFRQRLYQCGDPEAVFRELEALKEWLP